MILIFLWWLLSFERKKNVWNLFSCFQHDFKKQKQHPCLRWYISAFSNCWYLFFQACLLGGVLCVLAGVLCLISASWSAAITISVYNDPLVTQALKREVGSSVYIGWASSVLLLLGGALICFVCGEKERPRPPQYSFMQNSTNAPFTGGSSRPATLRSDTMRSNDSRMFDRHSTNRMVERGAPVYVYSSQYQAPSWYSPSQRTQPGSFRS